MLTWVFWAAITSCVFAKEPIAIYEIGWDGDAYAGWHTVPKLIEGASTIQFTNQGITSEVQVGNNGEQVFKTEIATETRDLLSFTEFSSSFREYVVKGEARCENLDGQVSIAMGVSNSNYAGTVSRAVITKGKDERQGAQDWQSFTLACDLSPAIRPSGAAEPNRFIAEMGLKRSGTGTLYLRNMRLEVYERDSPSGQNPAREKFSLDSFVAGFGVGVAGCLIYFRFRIARRRLTGERELRRIASLDVPHRDGTDTPLGVSRVNKMK